MRIHDIVRCPECLRLVPLDKGRYFFAHTNIETRHLCRLSGRDPFHFDDAPEQPTTPIDSMLFGLNGDTAKTFVEITKQPGDTATAVEIPKPPKQPKQSKPPKQQPKALPKIQPELPMQPLLYQKYPKQPKAIPKHLATESETKQEVHTRGRHRRRQRQNQIDPSTSTDNTENANEWF